MEGDIGQGSVLVCSPNSSLMNLGLCYSVAQEEMPESSTKPKKKRSKPRHRDAKKYLTTDSASEMPLEILPTEDQVIADIVDDLRKASLGPLENKKPKKLRKRKKSSGEKEKKDVSSSGTTETVKDGSGLEENIDQDVTDNTPNIRRGLQTPQKSQIPRSPKLNEPYFQDNKKTASKKKSSSSRKKAEDNNFEEYLSLEEVEVGLKNKTMVAGSIRINQRCYKEAYISSEGDDKDIMIEGLKNRNRALEGDEVVVLINHPSLWKGSGQRTGKVVHIKELCHPRVSVGKLQSSVEPSSSYVVFSPRDPRVPRLRIPLGDPTLPPDYLRDPAAYADTLLSARITAWTDPNYAHGVVEVVLGDGGDVEVETMAILLEQNLDPRPHNPLHNILFPSLPYTIPEEEIAKRLDLRKECIFTIDPATARDLDDAVSARRLENGNIEVGVHISDVSHFLGPNTVLDHAVCKKATTIYLVQRVYHMLPVELCHLCSLTAGEDKLAFSVFAELTPDARVVSHRFTRSVIHSCAQLAYEHAQMVIDNPEKTFTEADFPPVTNGFTAEDCAKRIRDLYRLSEVMRKRRFDSGALRIDQPKLCFHLDPETLTPLSSFIYVNKESHRLIEEFMLLANMIVAEQIFTAYPEIAFLRHHLEPRSNMMIDLQKRLESYGIHLDISDAGSLHSSMLKYSTPCEGEDEAITWARYIVLNQLCAKPMLRANYFCPEEGVDCHHYALNAPLYTHFTSPIRRYADVMVHRLLAASLGLADPPTWTKNDIRRIAGICNRQKQAAKVAGEKSSQLFLALYLQEPVESLAAVIDVKDRSADVIVKDFGVVLRVYTDQLNAKVQHENDGDQVQLYIQWNDGGMVQLVQLFSVVRVLVSRAKDGLKLVATLLPPHSR